MTLKSNIFNEIPYEIEIKPRNRNIYFVVKDNKLTIRTPKKLSTRKIESLILERESWIKSKINNNKAEELTLCEGGKVLFLGEKKEVKLINSTKQLVAIDKQNIVFYTDDFSKANLTMLINEFYAKITIIIVSKCLDSWGHKMQLTPNKIGFRNTKTRWGSCSGNNNLSFNIQLAQLPELIIEYIVVHELAHIIHKNHSSNFWNFVGEYIVDYKKRKKILREFEKILI